MLRGQPCEAANMSGTCIHLELLERIEGFWGKLAAVCFEGLQVCWLLSCAAWMFKENPKMLSLLINGAVFTRFVFSHLPRRTTVRRSWKNLGEVLALLKEMGVLPMASSLWWDGICPTVAWKPGAWSCGPPGPTLDVSLQQGLGAPWRCTSSHWLQRASSDQAPHISMVHGREEFCFHQLGPDLQNKFHP